MQDIEPEQILADAISYLVDAGQRDLAEMLYQCNIRILAPSPSTNWMLTCGRRELYDTLALKAPLWSYKNIDMAFQASSGGALRLAHADIRFGSLMLEQQARVASMTRLALPDSVRNHQLSVRGPHTTLDGVVVALNPIPPFSTGTYMRKKRTGFVIMSFSPDMRMVYDDAIKPAVTACGLNCFRVDEGFRTGDIVLQVWTALIEAAFVIADITDEPGKGLPGNTLYELGLAHAVGHDVILLTQDRKTVPFDLGQRRYIEYSTAQLRKLRQDLATALQPYVTAP